jgi:hypothetical protein
MVHPIYSTNSVVETQTPKKNRGQGGRDRPSIDQRILPNLANFSIFKELIAPVSAPPSEEASLM